MHSTSRMLRHRITSIAHFNSELASRPPVNRSHTRHTIKRGECAFFCSVPFIAPARTHTVEENTEITSGLFSLPWHLNCRRWNEYVNSIMPFRQLSNGTSEKRLWFITRLWVALVRWEPWRNDEKKWHFLCCAGTKTLVRQGQKRTEQIHLWGDSQEANNEPANSIESARWALGKEFGRIYMRL